MIANKKTRCLTGFLLLLTLPGLIQLTVYYPPGPVFLPAGRGINLFILSVYGDCLGEFSAGLSGFGNIGFRGSDPS